MLNNATQQLDSQMILKNSETAELQEAFKEKVRKCQAWEKAYNSLKSQIEESKRLASSSSSKDAFTSPTPGPLPTSSPILHHNPSFPPSTPSSSPSPSPSPHPFFYAAPPTSMKRVAGQDYHYPQQHPQQQLYIENPTMPTMHTPIAHRMSPQYQPYLSGYPPTSYPLQQFPAHHPIGPNLVSPFNSPSQSPMQSIQSSRSPSPLLVPQRVRTRRTEVSSCR